MNAGNKGLAESREGPARAEHCRLHTKENP
ncbi:hypothetical protein J2S64_003683 [Paeniglutamicibacter sulfureus]|uniref:Uncharacterized protein n=1 Tax=Paeniglutamicibacter sulfureus TaxID=43666 RepID=A0ABU2BMV4_9MICC|nr:hypothetical protein [Paeniglutamicibacter sulfureus]